MDLLIVDDTSEIIRLLTAWLKHNEYETHCANDGYKWLKKIGIKMNKLWFEGSIKIDCTIKAITDSFNNIGEHYVSIVGLMPGMTIVELLDQGSDFVTIKTNEGIMKRTNISKHVETERIVLEFDEEYQAGKTITTNSHFVEKFEEKDNKIRLQIEISNLKAPGFMGFFYKIFGSKNTGNAFLNAYEKYFVK